MNWRDETKPFLYIVSGFIIAYFLPVGYPPFNNAVNEALALLRWYAREHVLLCLVPAFFIAGVIAVFVSQASVIKYFGAQAKKWFAYLVASVSGAILAVCSCTVLPLFSGIYKRGAGLGPAIAFLYSGPAINILAIILTARILGIELGIARVIGAVSFSILIGIIMAFLYRKEETHRAEAQLAMPIEEPTRPLWHTTLHFFILVSILVFANWAQPDGSTGLWYTIFAHKWFITGFFGLAFAFSLSVVLRLNVLSVVLATLPVVVVAFVFYHQPLVPFITAIVTTTILLARSNEESQQWLHETWSFAKQILPLLAGGVLIAGFFFGGPERDQGIIPNEWITMLVGGNSFFSNFFASIVGAFMYFATLTEVPIVHGLLNSGMGKGPALALLLASPALSLPNMLVIRSVIGTQKTIVYVALVVIMATVSGMIFGSMYN